MIWNNAKSYNLLKIKISEKIYITVTFYEKNLSLKLFYRWRKKIWIDIFKKKCRKANSWKRFFEKPVLKLFLRYWYKIVCDGVIFNEKSIRLQVFCKHCSLFDDSFMYNTIWTTISDYRQRTKLNFILLIFLA